MLSAFILGRERSFDQDPRYGLIVLGEIAAKVAVELPSLREITDIEDHAALFRTVFTVSRDEAVEAGRAVTAALATLGRNGVPVYVLYQAGRPPVVLSEILSVSDVRAVLARL